MSGCVAQILFSCSVPGVHYVQLLVGGVFANPITGMIQSQNAPLQSSYLEILCTPRIISKLRSSILESSKFPGVLFVSTLLSTRRR